MLRTIVLVDDEESILAIEQEALGEIGLEVEPFSNPIQAWERIQRGDVALVVTDWNMPQMTGMELLFKTRALQTPPYVIVVTAHGTIPRAVQAMNQGAFSFFEKPFDIHSYQELVRNSLDHFQRSKTVPVRESTTNTPTKSKDLAVDPIAHSGLLRQSLAGAQDAAGTDSSVLLLGESGSGKEMVADYIHRHSRRSSKPFIKINCGALPEHLMESELFGHEKGAFTGAIRKHIGRFELAAGGTLFLDEIGDLLPSLQVKLLRVLQERKIERIGGSAPIPVDFRLICATHCDLRAGVAARTFREDLFYRINVIPLRIPALRERPDDIEPLSKHFFQLLRRNLASGPEEIGESALKTLTGYSWPGNVRQLRNAIEYALVFAKGQSVQACDLPDDVRSNSAPIQAPLVTPPQLSACNGTPAVPAEGLKYSMQETESRLLQETLARLHWRMTAVAHELKISRSTLYTRMQMYGIKRPS